MPAPTKRRLDALLCSYRVFRKAYEWDPVAFVHDCIEFPAGQKPTSYQDEILADFATHKLMAARGPRGLGKSAVASWAVHWHALTRDGDDWKIITTAGSWTQLKEFLWPEIHKWGRRIQWSKIGRGPYTEKDELLEHSLKLKTGRAFASSPDRPAFAEGAHADRLLYLYDEAKAIPDAFFNATEGAGLAPDDAAHETMRLMISTPGVPSGRFYDIHTRKPGLMSWRVRHVTYAETVAAQRLDPAKAAERKELWGEDSAEYQNYILGEFAAQDENSLIPLAWIEAAQDRWRGLMRAIRDSGLAPPKLTAIGVDVAWMGKAKTTEALRAGMAILEVRTRSKQDPDATANEVEGLLKARGGVAVVDIIGMGASIVPKLTRAGVKAVGFNAAGKAEQHGKPITDDSGELTFLNLRAAAWWRLRDLLNPSNEHAVALPDDPQVTGDLTAPRRLAPRSGGKMQIEAKEDIAKRLKRSTDHGDAIMEAFALELLEVGIGASYGAPIGIGRAELNADDGDVDAA